MHTERNLQCQGEDSTEASVVHRLVGTPPEAKGERKNANQAAQPMASIPEAIYCSAPQIRYLLLDLYVCKDLVALLHCSTTQHLTLQSQ